MDIIGWLARTSDLISTEVAQNMIKAFRKHVSQPENPQSRDKYVRGLHGSSAADITVKRMINIFKTDKVEEDTTTNKLILLLNILEPLVINEENSARAVDSGMMEIISEVLAKEHFFAQISYRDFVIQASLLLKLLIRTLVSAIRLP